MTTLKTLEDIDLGETGNKYIYTGMVNKDNQPHGWGRAIRRAGCVIDHGGVYDIFIDAQWKDGVYHGYFRMIWYYGHYSQNEL